MRGNDAAYNDLAGAKHNLTNTYLLPESTATKYSAALKEHNLFRRIGTVIDRIPLSVRTLYEKFALEQKTGYLGVEHLDGMLIRPEAVKVLTITA